MVWKSFWSIYILPFRVPNSMEWAKKKVETLKRKRKDILRKFLLSHSKYNKLYCMQQIMLKNNFFQALYFENRLWAY